MKKAKKTVKIISELMTYLLNTGASNVNIDFNIDEDNCPPKIIILFKALIPELTASQLNKLNKELNTPRETQVEEYYWELAGEGNHASELSLVGMLIDSALVEYENSILEITLWRED